jgi:hypothetical protein
MNPNNSGTIEIALAGVTPLVAYNQQVTNLRVVADPQQNAVPGTYGPDGAPRDIPGQSKWHAEISYLQDWSAAAGSLSQFAFDNDGELADFSFVPDVDGAPTLSGQVYLVSGEYGGPAGEAWQVTTLSWPCNGKPTTTPAV